MVPAILQALERIRLGLVGTPWEERFQLVDIGPMSPRLTGSDIYRLGKPELDSQEPPHEAY